jgi:hypothetical protein
MKDFQAPEEVTSPIKNIGKTYFAFFVYHFVLPDRMRIRKRKEQYCMYSIYILHHKCTTVRKISALSSSMWLSQASPQGTDKIQTWNNLAGGKRTNLSSTPHPLFVMQHLYLSVQHPYLSAQRLPHPFLSCATPLFSYRYATPLLSCATSLLCYATSLLSYATSLLSYASPLLCRTTAQLRHTKP